jgi:predicted phage terminase large subunit-like protein
MPENNVADITKDNLWKLMYLRKLKSIDHHLDFIKYVWKNPSEKFIEGIHTRKICEIIDESLERYRNGKSSFHVIMVPYRHGKSEIISRKLPAHYLGLFPDGKVILAGHTADLTIGFSRESRNLVSAKEYKELFPKIKVEKSDSSASHWKIADHQGECFAVGLGGAMAGQGYTLGILDDYCRSRADAESAKMRDGMWQSFTNDFMTRRAPVSITIILATPWHTDDIIARIRIKVKEEPSFPRFDFHAWPAFSDNYKEGILFPERFNKAWYDEQRATLGEYGSSSLLQLSPTKRGGYILKTDNIKKVPLSSFPEISYTRVWDLAHTEKERTKSDPDYTSGTLLSFRKKPGSPREWELWIKDVNRFRLDAPHRDAKINITTILDGPYVKIAIEDSLDAKDALKTIQALLMGQRIVTPIRLKGDKVTRASPLEPIFEAGNVYVPDGAPWISDWAEELTSFPMGTHDDMVDNLSSGYALYNKASGVITADLAGV